MLQAVALPERWRARGRFVVLTTTFADGHLFLATWLAWRRDPRRCDRLVFVAVDPQPPTLDAWLPVHDGTPLQALARELARAWPPLSANVHTLAFDGDRVQLLLACGPPASWLPALRVEADALVLETDAGVAGASGVARLLTALGRRAVPGATLTLDAGVAAAQGPALAASGFVVDAPGDGETRGSVARYAPRARRARPADGRVDARRAVVVGAGIAGAAVAQALARQGLQVEVFDRHGTSAAEASGQPAALFHGIVHADDGPYARLYRAAALEAQRCYGGAIASGAVAGAAAGLLRVAEHDDTLAAMQALLARCALPAAYVQALDAAAATQRAGLALARPAWLYPGGGWIDPAAWCRLALTEPGVHLVGGVAVARLSRQDAAWRLHDADDRVVGAAPIVVLANARGAAPLAAPWLPRPWPLRHSRGQTSLWRAAPARPRCALAGDGYALPTADGALVFGATREFGDPAANLPSAPELRAQDHGENVQRLQRLCGIEPPPPGTLTGCTGWRLHTDDRLPIAGALPVAPGGGRLDQGRLLAREPGLFVLAALGSRGVTLAPLLGRLVAAMAVGAPWPLEQDLVDAVDPARWQVRAARAAGGAARR